MKDSGEVEGEEKQRSYPLLLAGGIVLTIIYVVTISSLGFFLATITYLALFMVIGRYRNWTVIAISSLLGSLALVFIFMKVVYVSLPLGVEPFSAVSLLLLRVMGVH
jgi:putative tricarboxylic transport membrane protein